MKAIRWSDGVRVDLAVAVPIAEQNGGRAGTRGPRGQRGPPSEPAGGSEGVARVEHLNLCAAVGVAIHGDEIIPAVAGHIGGADRRAAQVVLALVGLIHVLHEDEPGRRRIEQQELRLRVGRLVERGELLRAARAREVADGKPRERGVELGGTRVIGALRPAERER